MILEQIGVAHIRLQHVYRLVPGHVSHLEDGGAPVPAVLTSLGIDQRDGKRQVASLMGLGSRARGVAGEFHLQGGEYGLCAGGCADLDRHPDEVEPAGQGLGAGRRRRDGTRELAADPDPAVGLDLDPIP